jgi:hypothetical protein
VNSPDIGLVRVVRGLAVELMVRDIQCLSSGKEDCVLDGKVKMRTLTIHASPDAIKHMLAVSGKILRRLPTAYLTAI